MEKLPDNPLKQLICINPNSLENSHCQISAIEKVFSDLPNAKTVQLKRQRQAAVIATAGSYCSSFVCQQVDLVAQKHLSAMVMSPVQTLTWNDKRRDTIFL